MTSAWRSRSGDRRSRLHEKLARHARQAFDPSLRDRDAFRDFKAHGLKPEAGHEMKGHTGLKLGPVAGTQTHSALAPIGWIADADRIAGAIVFDDAVSFEDRKKRIGDVFADIARLGGGKPRLHAFERRLFGVEESLVRLAKKDGARQRAMIAFVTASDLEESPLAFLQWFVVPGEMRRRRVLPRRQKRHNGGIVAANPIDAAQAGIIDFSHKIVLTHPRLNRLDDTSVHGLDDLPSLPHIIELGWAFDGAEPIDKRCRVFE